MIKRLFFFLVGCALLAPQPGWARDKTGTPLLVVSGNLVQHGKARAPLVFDEATLRALPQHTFTVATPWHPRAQRFEGPLLRDVLAAAGAAGQTLSLRALNDYVITIPLEDAEQYDVILARKRNGKPMTVRDKGPLFVIYPFHQHPELRQAEYYRRCVWQLAEIIVH
ncbi:molybdopterin-dependent oxidoreductase [Chitiniphilus purpureus]|uniref:Molybdopterin-dependent oxidoreductase n=1 Tax=Chitiniphilus purpureus TaxID=2981137 RepID=A0ABY6DRB3_9NEIS|nr:molybdopterin-dependent oxidoreductase [Chitiniphilus sp. CD1]UXY16253.1 molybdopterin-dependent oxidoreductase [Chitiniphilus sp. CD1]